MELRRPAGGARVTVVGAGINGMLAALALNRCGCAVTLLDRGGIPEKSAASYGLHRLIHPWSAQTGYQTAARAQAALEQWRHLLAEIGAPQQFVPCGVLAVGAWPHRDGDPVAVRTVAPDAAVRLLPLLDGGARESSVLFPDFGVLMASGILRALVRTLSAQGVHVCPFHPVRRADPGSGDAHLSDGRVVPGDAVVIAAGTGTPGLLAGSPGLRHCAAAGGAAQRCYVLYADPPAPLVQTAGWPAWASLGGDTWGMPPLRKVPMKLGYGGLTHPAGPEAPDAAARLSEIVSAYARSYPLFRRIRPRAVRFNHWTRINNDAPFEIEGRCYVTCSDDGAGFKTAPLVARDIANAVCRDLETKR